MNSWIQFPFHTSHRTKQLFSPKVRLHLDRQRGAAKSTYHIGNWLAFHNNTLYKQNSQRLTTQLSHTCKTVVTSTSLHRTWAIPAGYTAFHRPKWHIHRLTNIDHTLNQCVTVGRIVTFLRAPYPPYITYGRVWGRNYQHGRQIKNHLTATTMQHTAFLRVLSMF